ncbi:putative voltage-gated potassium channel subunit beta [Fusarium oxysporum f. sp. albedinis]|nr:putative voltage-gated potassium channel subunit beta [Fusarium oxysporum f. sp. albedinis]
MRCDWSAGNWDRGEPNCWVNRWVIICNLLPGFAWYGVHYGTVCQIITDNASIASTIMLDGIVDVRCRLQFRNDNRYCSRFQLIASLTEPVAITRSGNPSKDNNLTRPIVVIFANV